MQKLGAIVVAISAIFKTEEARYLLDDSGAAAVFATEELTNFVPADCGALRLRVTVDGTPPPGWAALTALVGEGGEGFVSVARQADDDAALLYSSGTTGFPKGIMLTQHNIHTNTATAASCSNYQPGDRLAMFLPLFHVFAQNYIMNAGFEPGRRWCCFAASCRTPCSTISSASASPCSSPYRRSYIALLGARTLGHDSCLRCATICPQRRPCRRRYRGAGPKPTAPPVQRATA